MERLNPLSTYFALGTRDLFQAGRRLLRAPGFTLASVLTFGLGLGVTTAIFSVLYAALWASLPYPRAERLVIIRERQPEFPSSSVAYPNYLDLRASQTTLQDLAIFRQESIILSGAGIGGEPESLVGGRVSWEFLRTAGVKPKPGRDFREEDDKPGAARTAIISAALFARRLNKDAGVVGRSVVVNGVAHTIIGVLPPSFDLLGRADILVPMGEERGNEGTLSRANHPGYSILGRVEAPTRGEQKPSRALLDRILGRWQQDALPQATIRRVQADLDRIYRRLEIEHPDSNTGVRSSIEPLLESRVGNFRSSLYLIFAATGCVLLIACANVANLFLARGVGRQRELAIRASVGAGRAQLMRELIAENNVVMLLGWGFAILLAYWSLDLIVALSPSATLRLDQVQINASVFIWSSVAVLLCETIFGLWPAWQISRSVQLSEVLGGSGRGASANVQTQRARNALVVMQVAVALVLLAAAGLLLRSYANLQRVRLGFSPDQLLVFKIALPSERYGTDEKETRFFTALNERIARLPNVAAAADAVMLPFGNNDWSQSYHLTGTPPNAPGSETNMYVSPIGADYFAALKMPILRGRAFNAEDGAKAPVRVIVDEAFVARHFQDSDPIGKQLDATVGSGPNRPPMTIIGVVPTTRRELGRLPAFPQVYFHAPQNSGSRRFVVVRVKAGDPLALAPVIRREIAALDPDQPMADVTTMERMIGESLATQRLVLWLFGIFAGLALLLAVIGIYSVMALSVIHRTREMGIRMALGADRSTILQLVLRQGLTLVALGLGIGLLIAIASARALRSVLYEVGSLDPLVLLVVALVLTATGALACWIPARRATRVDPVEALRAE